MSFLSGVLTAAVFFLCLLFFFYLGIRYEYKKKPPDKVETNEQEKRKMEQYNQHFKKLFAYDVETALQRKKVD